ncbi:MAG TPA: hypothetical protein VK959_05115 [Methylophilaceae bacterium]|jgi:hypothetical protein|nr:hypothetical protein [Methylophilaceae bacterium]
MRWQTLAFIALVGFGAYQFSHTSPVEISRTGILIANEPQQLPINSPPRLTLENYRVEPLAKYTLEARVLGTERYRLGREADISPVDFALGWGAMSDTTVLEEIDISQSGRFYFWRVDEFPIPREEIEAHSANTHMIPADAAVARRLKEVRPGQIVRLRGYLVAISADDGWQWRSSLSRTDTGNGACELMWVESVEIGTVS